VQRRASRPGAGRHALVLGALGVVFGDIGTSPLYALHVAFTSSHDAVAPTRAGVYGVISLVFGALMLVVTVKYLTFIMRADNDGEGGILALLALVDRLALPARALRAVALLGMLGAALFYGDGMITPAISVLSAVEGLDVAAPGVRSLVVPIALGALLALFAVQRRGTGAVGRVFGPVMAVWFAAIAAAGLAEVVAHPAILQALSPTFGVRLLLEDSHRALVVLGAVVLTVTGAEALYADLGHFGRSPIRWAWLGVVFPALTLNYLGQGALVLRDPQAIDHPFFRLAPSWGQVPMIVLATAATLIASQAVISGAFSLSHQAIGLGLLPAMRVDHTSEEEAGQVYVPVVNWALCVAVVALVVGFGSSAALGSAYGVAVTATMTITTLLFLVLSRTGWRWPLAAVLAAAAGFLVVDLGLFAASLTKVAHGGWLPLGVGGGVLTILSTWRTGRERVLRLVAEREGPLRRFVTEVRRATPPPHRTPGTAVFLSSDEDTTPLALRDNLRHNGVVHQSVVVIRVRTLNTPRVAPAQRLSVDALGYREDGITLVTARFGFQEAINLPVVLSRLARRGAEHAIDVRHASYFLSRITVVPAGGGRVMRRWRKRLFITMWRTQAEPIEVLRVPEERTVTMGSVIEL
jgi:KUP system potassium uptake protein